jgi:hypothetical protein
MQALEQQIDAAWERRTEISPANVDALTRRAVEAALATLESGERRVAEPDGNGGWQVNQWLKKAVLLSFRLNPNRVMDAEPAPYYDKVDLRFQGFDEARFRELGARAVPGAIVRRGAYIGRDVVLMPSFVNAHLRSRDRRDLLRPRARGQRRRVGLAAGRRRQPQPLLRRDRQACRREDAQQDLGQRTAAGRLR